MVHGSKQYPTFVIMAMNRWECSLQIVSCFGTNLPCNINQFDTLLFVIIVGCDVMKRGSRVFHTVATYIPDYTASHDARPYSH